MNFSHPQTAPILHLEASSEHRKVEDGRWRVVTIAFLFTFCYLLLAMRLIGVSVADRSFFQLVNDAVHDIGSAPDEAVANVRILRGEVTPYEEARWQPAVPELVTPRQSIRDRNGVLIASSVASRSLYARPQEIDNPEAVLQKVMQIIPRLNQDVLLRRLHSSAKFVWLQRHLTPQEQEAILWAGIPGLYLHDDYRRLYPHGNLFSHVLGYTDVDGNGLAGVEKYFNDRLSVNDEMKPLELSLDMRIQQVLYSTVSYAMQEYRAIGATGAIFHIPTGQARALVSLPDYDPNRPLDFTSEARFNRLSVGQYELGSVFKALSLAMAVEYGGITMHDGFDATQPIAFKGNVIRDFHPKRRWLSVPEIMVYSSNIGTVKMVAPLGAAKQREFLTNVGLFRPVGIELKEQSVPVSRKEWKPVESATISYGHGISITPMHLIRAMLTVTGGGEFRDLTLVQDTQKDAQQIISRNTSRQLNRLMRAVVQHGTASKADVPGYAVGAKTGTANKVDGGRYSAEKKISSLVAAFPMPDPQYFIFVMLDEPKGTKETFNYATAGWVAAPAAAEIISHSAPILGIPPIYQDAEDEIDRMIIDAEMQAKNLQQPERSRYVQRTSY